MKFSKWKQENSEAPKEDSLELSDDLKRIVGELKNSHGKNKVLQALVNEMVCLAFEIEPSLVYEGKSFSITGNVNRDITIHGNDGIRFLPERK